MNISSSPLGRHLFAVVAATLALLHFSLGESLEGEREMSQSSEFKALDSYLHKQLQLKSTDTSIVVPRLGEVIEALVSLGPDNFATLDSENEDAGRKFKELLAVQDFEQLLKLARDFSEASKSCDDKSLSFLVSATSTTVDNQNKQQQTGEQTSNNDGSFLVRFAKSLLDKCWRFHSDKYIADLVKATGKMHDEFFVLLEQIANRLSNARLAKERRAHGSISINDEALPNNLGDKIRALKLLSLLSRQEQQVFVLALRKEFASREAMKIDGADEDDQDDDDRPTKEFIRLSRTDELAKFKEFFKQKLVEPCRQLAQRMEDPLREIKASGELHSKSTQTASLIEQNPGNFNFIYMLEAHRICNQMVIRQDKILKLF